MAPQEDFHLLMLALARLWPRMASPLLLLAFLVYWLSEAQ